MRAKEKVSFFIWGALGFGVLTILLTAANATFIGFNGGRLLAPFAFVKGFPLYTPLESSPVILGLQGPFTVLAYLPITIFSTPNLATWAAALLAASYYFIPFLILLFSERGSKNALTRNDGWLLAALFILSTRFFVPLERASSWVHADAPALGLGLVAVIFFVGKQQTWRHLLLAYFFAAASVWAKSSMLPIIVALPLLAFASSFRRGLLHTALAAAAMLSVSVGLGLVFSFEGLYFHIFKANLIASWVGDIYEPLSTRATSLSSKVKVLAQCAAELFSYATGPLLLVLVASLSLWNGKKSLRQNIATLSEPRWFPLIWVGLWLVPPSLLGRAKVGGGPNTLAPSLYFFVAGAVILCGEFLKKTKGTNGFLARPVLFNAVVIITGFVGLSLLPVTYSQLRMLEHVALNRQNYAFELAKQRPGFYYFPDFPLAHLLAERKLYHSGRLLGEYIIDHQYPMPRENITAHLPQSVTRVLLEEPDNGLAAFLYPEHKRQAWSKDYWMWVVYEKKPQSEPASQLIGKKR